MGDRPTFLDVAYLAVGFERAKSVAKLQMRFGSTLYSGTAFLVTPDTLLTAHHNLWVDNQRADEVNVIFDYERSADGPELQATDESADLNSFVAGLSRRLGSTKTASTTGKAAVSAPRLNRSTGGRTGRHRPTSGRHAKAGCLAS
jgi:V8-like Glu-specific endopeptidase